MGRCQDEPTSNLLGVNAFKGVIPEGTSALHFMLWKFMLIALTKNSLDGDPITPTDIIDRAMKRLREKIKATRYAITLEINRSESRGKDPDFKRFRRYIAGIGTVEQDGALKLHDELDTLFSVL